MHHVTPLRKIYNKYATLGNEPSPDNTYVLSRMQFWRLLKDADLPSPDHTLCIMDRALAGGVTGEAAAAKSQNEKFEPLRDLLTTTTALTTAGAKYC